MVQTINGKIYQPLGEIVQDLTFPYGLANALETTHTKGLEAASLPRIIQLQLACPDFKDPLWNSFAYGMSGVYRVGDYFFFTHGKGHPLARPQRIRRAIDKGLINGAARLTPSESRSFNSKEQLSYKEFLRQSDRETLVEPYTVRAEAILFERLQNAHIPLQDFPKDPRTIIYIGGKDAAEHYAEKLREKGLRSFYVGLDTAEGLPNRGRVLCLGSDGYGGLDGDDSLGNYGRVLGVAPEAHVVAKNSLERKLRSA